MEIKVLCPKRLFQLDHVFYLYIQSTILPNIGKLVITFNELYLTKDKSIFKTSDMPTKVEDLKLDSIYRMCSLLSIYVKDQYQSDGIW